MITDAPCLTWKFHLLLKICNKLINPYSNKLNPPPLRRNPQNLFCPTNLNIKVLLKDDCYSTIFHMSQFFNNARMYPLSTYFPKYFDFFDQARFFKNELASLKITAIFYLKQFILSFFLKNRPPGLERNFERGKVLHKLKEKILGK